MPVTRRVLLLEWARRTGSLVLEDDYDGEFRYDVSPLPALRSLPGAQDHVVYIGTASKLIAPSLRVAWIAPPHAPARAAAPRAREPRGLVVNEATGTALAEFVASGSLAAHHARVTRTYAARRAALVAAASRHLPGAVLEGVEAGLHVVLRLPDDVDDLDVVTRLERLGLAASPLSAYAVSHPGARARALLRRAARDPGRRRDPHRRRRPAPDRTDPPRTPEIDRWGTPGSLAPGPSGARRARRSTMGRLRARCPAPDLGADRTAHGRPAPCRRRPRSAAGRLSPGRRGPGCGSDGIVPSRPAWKSSKACTSSARVFMTNGP